MVMDGWICAAVSVAFAGGAWLGFRVAWHIHVERIGVLRDQVEAAGREVDRWASTIRPVLVSLGHREVADRMDAMAQALVNCGRKADP